MEEFTVKRILYVLPLSFLIVVGGGFFVLANDNAGEPLYSWYEKEFSENKNNLLSFKENLSFLDIVKNKNQETENKILVYALESTEGVKESVYRKQEEYKAELKAVSEELVSLYEEKMKLNAQDKKQKEVEDVSKNVEVILFETLNENE